MNYELAKKLKDAGFPQDNCEYFYKGAFSYHYTQPTRLKRPILIANPTLSELIEACGDDFCCVRLVRKGLWIAEMKKGNLIAQGSTPEEAVANLWLALRRS